MMAVHIKDVLGVGGAIYGYVVAMLLEFPLSLIVVYTMRIIFF